MSNEKQIELKEWIQSLEAVIDQGDPERVQNILDQMQRRAAREGIFPCYAANTPYLNTISKEQQPTYPGNREIERRIKSLIRWNAMAMVVRANRESGGIGGHISSYASAATLYEVAFNHILRGKDHPEGGDQVYIQGHASPGIYARAFLEGRISKEQVRNFRQELRKDKGLSSYPHPYLMPEFWEFPTVSMGLSPIMAIYQARFNRYLEDRGLKDQTGRVFAFLGDGETDEPETLGAISLAAREQLDNLTFIVNCNLQRLDGPVRGNGKIIQELERNFRGAGWNVLKVIWGDSWDSLLEKDEDGLLATRMEEAVDGDYQKYVVSDGAYIREHFFGTDPRLKELVKDLSDEELQKLRRGGHDPEKVYAAFKAAEDRKGAPTVILMKTIKGYGLGEAGEGKNITHQQKKLNEEELRHFRTRFNIPLDDESVGCAPLYIPGDDSEEIQYLKARREKLGGFLPERRVNAEKIEMPDRTLFEEFYGGSDGKPVSTTMAFVRLLAKLLRDKNVGQSVVPIIPDEARTFGMEALFRQVGIYSHVGQKYEPVDKETLLYYKEATNGQILEEGITEAGGMSSFLAAATAYASHGKMMLPFFAFYSMFGFQRVSDLIWAGGDMRARGFLMGATAGRTTLAGEGLQHQDGHSLLLAHPHPHVRAYDPAFAYEIAVLIEEGMQRMFVDQEDAIYYLTIGNEPYPMLAMPEGSREGIIKGMHCIHQASEQKKAHVQLLGSGAILHESIRAQELLQEFDVSSDVWSVTSYNELFREAEDVDRWNRLHRFEAQKTSHLQKCIEEKADAIVAASDYVQALPSTLARWMPPSFVVLGTDGFGRSDGRKALRNFFEVSAEHIAFGALSELARQEKISKDVFLQAQKKWDIDTERASAIRS